SADSTMPGPKLNPMIGFFSTPKELSFWVREWIESFDLQYALLRSLTAFKMCKEVAWDNIAALSCLLETYDEVILDLDWISAEMADVNEMALKNPNRLDINIPKMVPGGLREGGLGSVSQDPRHLSTWRKIARSLIAKTKSGMWVVHPSMPGKR